MQVKKQQLEPHIEQWTGSKLGNEYVKAVYCHPAYLTSMQSTSWETLGWMMHKPESRLPGEISITSDNADNTTLMAESEELNSLLMKVNEESEKAGLKFNIQKMEIMASGPITSWQIDGETLKTVRDFFIFFQWKTSQLIKNPQCRRPRLDSWVGKIPWRRDRLPTPVFLGFPCVSACKESACNAGDLGSLPGLGRSPEEGIGYPLQYSGLEISMDCIVHGVTKSWTQLSDFHFHRNHSGRWLQPWN